MQHKSIIGAIILAVALMLLTGCEPETGAITGRVLDSLTNKPISNAAVTVANQVLQTNADGLFQLKDVKPGNYTVSVNATDYEPTSVQAMVKPRQSVTVELKLAPLKVSATVGAQGNTVIGPKQAKLELPPQAIAQDTVLNIQVVANPQTPPSEVSFASPVYEINLGTGVEPLSAPAKLTLPLSSDALNAKSDKTLLTVAYWDGSEWIPIGGEVDSQSNTITVAVSHLSLFSTFLCLKGASLETEHFIVKSCVEPKTFTTSEMAQRLEAAWTLLIGQMGYDTPIPIFGGRKVEAWIVDLTRPAAGLTNLIWWEELLGFDYLDARLYIDANTPLDVGEVVTHEFFHVIQFNSYLHPHSLSEIEPLRWWEEATATWAASKIMPDEEEVYKYYYQKAQPLLKTSLDDLSDAYHPYLASVFARYLEQKYGAEAIKQTWKQLSLRNEPFHAIDSVLRQYGSTLSDAYFEFAAQYAYAREPDWLQKTMGLERDRLYPTAATIGVTQEHMAQTVQRAHLSGEAFRLVPATNVSSTQSASLKLTFDWGSAPEAWRARLFIEKADGSVASTDIAAPTADYEIPAFGRDVKDAVVIAVNVSLSQDNATLVISSSAQLIAQQQPEVQPAPSSLTVNPAQLTSEGVFDFALNEKGDGVVFLTKTGDLIETDFAGRTRTRLTQHPLSNIKRVILPDRFHGEAILEKDDDHLYYYNFKTGTEKQLDDHQKIDKKQIKWSPDGKRIIYFFRSYDKPSESGLAIAKPDNSEYQVITRYGDPELEYRWDQPNTVSVYSAPYGYNPGSLFKINLETLKSEKIAMGFFDEIYLKWSPLERFYITTEGAAENVLMVRDIEENRFTKLPFVTSPDHCVWGQSLKLYCYIMNWNLIYFMVPEFFKDRTWQTEMETAIVVNNSGESPQKEEEELSAVGLEPHNVGFWQLDLAKGTVSYIQVTKNQYQPGKLLVSPSEDFIVFANKLDENVYALPVLQTGLVQQFNPVSGFAPPPAGPMDLTVCPSGCPYSSTQAAIDAAASGATIHIGPGKYKGSLNINKKLTLVGAGQKQTIGGELNIQRKTEVIEVTIQDLTVNDVWVYGKAKVVFIRTTVGNKQEKSGIIHAEDQAGIILSESQVLGLNNVGVELQDFAQAEVRNSSIEQGTGDGLVLQDSAQAEMQGSRIENNSGNGIILRDKAQLKLLDSVIRNNGLWGIAISQRKTCGEVFSENNDFTGKVDFQGSIIIEGNNKSGYLKDMGNPGNHPWNKEGIPDGQICLP